MVSQRVRHDSMNTHTYAHTHPRGTMVKNLLDNEEDKGDTNLIPRSE